MWGSDVIFCIVVCVLSVSSGSVVDMIAEMSYRKDNEDVRTYICTYMGIIVPVTTWYYLVW